MLDVDYNNLRNYSTATLHEKFKNGQNTRQDIST